jgi:hypothetical protein
MNIDLDSSNVDEICVKKLQITKSIQFAVYNYYTSLLLIGILNLVDVY